ncbi:MAG: nitronate monooxygenase [Lachnospiraceae bacterium]|nr:nitronate monooxygenase [Lachnospiraceae bacterium]
MKELKIGNLTAKIPLIQGGMGVGISLGNLAGSVAKAGGIGIISTAQIGFRDKDFKDNPLKANLKAIVSEMKKARCISKGGIIGYNIMVATKNYKDQVQAAVKAGADVIISGAGLPVDLPEYIGESKVKIAPIVSSDKSAKVLLKIWDRRFKRTADFVVIEGPKAGGHLGFIKEQLDEYKQLPSKFGEEIKRIIETVKDYGKKYNINIPIVVAGGITTRQDVQEAFDMGADGVQVATRFITTKECDAADGYKEAFINAKEDDIVIVDSPVGMKGRAILNSFMSKVKAGEKLPPKQCFGCLKKCNPAEIPYCITERLVLAAQGNADEGLLFCGANAWLENKITTVNDVIRDLFGE